MSRKASERLKGVASHVQDLIDGQVHVRHLDETGFGIGGRNGFTLPVHRFWPSTGSAPNAVIYYPVSRVVSYMIIGSPASRWMGLPTRCAMLTIYRNCRRWSKSKRNTGPVRCNGSCVGRTMSHRRRGITASHLQCRLPGLSSGDPTGSSPQRWISMRRTLPSHHQNRQGGDARSAGQGIIRHYHCAITRKQPDAFRQIPTCPSQTTRPNATCG